MGMLITGHSRAVAGAAERDSAVLVDKVDIVLISTLSTRTSRQRTSVDNSHAMGPSLAPPRRVTHRVA
ncbi:MAG: hypothetical protein GY807_14255 [Gammaproteobacteria bacterium]|nr:hypothetical protein [Gammaproteobacteria bacterium]